MPFLSHLRRRKFLIGTLLGSVLFLIVYHYQSSLNSELLHNGDRANLQEPRAKADLVLKQPSPIVEGKQNNVADKNETKIEGGVTTKLDIVVGIPTIRRTGGADYLEQTLSSLLLHRKSFDRVVFVVYAADADRQRADAVAQSVRANHLKEVESGMIHIITPPDNLYPDWEKDLKLTLGDPFYQVKWRSKQNLDQAYLMEYAHSLNPKYYLMLEDDVSATDDYLNIIYEHAESVWRDNLLIISYCKWGAIGKLFSDKMLPTISAYLRVFWNQKPLDWLISDLLRIMACRYPPNDCEKDINSIKEDFSRQLFAHNGKISSLLTENPG